MGWGGGVVARFRLFGGQIGSSRLFFPILFVTEWYTERMRLIQLFLFSLTFYVHISTDWLLNLYLFDLWGGGFDCLVANLRSRFSFTDFAFERIVQKRHFFIQLSLFSLSSVKGQNITMVCLN